MCCIDVIFEQKGRSESVSCRLIFDILQLHAKRPLTGTLGVGKKSRAVRLQWVCRHVGETAHSLRRKERRLVLKSFKLVSLPNASAGPVGAMSAPTPQFSSLADAILRQCPQLPHRAVVTAVVRLPN